MMYISTWLKEINIIYSIINKISLYYSFSEFIQTHERRITFNRILKYQHSQYFLTRYIQNKRLKILKEALIDKLTSEFEIFNFFGIDLNEANKTANKVQLTIKRPKI